MSDNPLVLQYSDGQLVPYQTPDPGAAAQRALDFTGIPDLAAGANALARGEWLPGLGQAASGAAGLLPLGKLAGAAKLGAELMPLAGMVKAWHGTPHLFEPVEHNPFGEFRDAAIGTGEGAQAYGHGHYVAGNPAVAGEYQSKLTRNTQASWDLLGKLEQDHPDLFKQISQEMGIDPFTTSKTTHLLDALSTGQKSSMVSQELHDKLISTGIFNSPPGALLEVHILPDEHELLDWDKPLGAQPEGVRKVIDGIHAGNEDLRIMHSGPDITGANFYRNLANQMWDKTREGIGGGSVAASKALHDAGIPGIKYLDRGSRDAGEGTSNYVIFDPKNLRIVGRNGQRLEPIEGDPFK